MKINLKFKKYFLVSFVVLILLPISLLAATPSYGLKETAGGAGYGTTPKAPEEVIGQIIYYAITFVGVIFLALTIYAGLLWMTAGGNEEKIKKAKKLITNSVIGLVIVLSAAAITDYILTKLVFQTLKS
jgi:hypothetical protein